MGLTHLFTMPKVPPALSGPSALAKKLSIPPNQPRAERFKYAYPAVLYTYL